MNVINELDPALLKARELSEVRSLLGSGANVNAVDGNGMSVLHRALERHLSLSVIQLLLDHGTNVNAVAATGSSVLHWAVEHLSSLSVIQLLLEHGANVNVVIEYVFSVLECALHRGNSIDVIQLLVEHGANVNVINMWEETPLTTLLRKYPSCLETFKLFLDHGAELDIIDDGHKIHVLNTALVYGSSSDIVKLLVDRGALVNTRHEDFMDSAESYYFFKITKRHIDNLETNTPGGLEPYGHTPLHLLVSLSRNCSYDLAQLLIERGAYANSSKTIIRDATENEFCGIDVLELLLLHGADPNLNYLSSNKDENELSKDVIKLLIKYNLLYKPESMLAHVVSKFPYLDSMDFERYHEECFKELDEMTKVYIAESITLYDFLSESYKNSRSQVDIEWFQGSKRSALIFEKYPLYRDNLLHKVPRREIVNDLELSINLKCQQLTGRAALYCRSLCFVAEFLSKEYLLNLISSLP